MFVKFYQVFKVTTKAKDLIKQSDLLPSFNYTIRTHSNDIDTNRSKIRKNCFDKIV